MAAQASTTTHGNRHAATRNSATQSSPVTCTATTSRAIGHASWPASPPSATTPDFLSAGVAPACFGGTAALALARSGADLAARVSRHGSLATSKPAEPGAVTAKVLVCHGAADPHVPMNDVTAFTDEMTAAGADWQV